MATKTKAQIAVEKQKQALQDKLDVSLENLKVLKDEYGLIDDMNDLTKDITKQSKDKLEVTKSIIDKTKEVLDNTKNITEETFTQVDLHKLERKAIAEGLEDRVKVIQKMKSVQQIQKETNRIVNVQANAFKSIGGSIDDMIKSIPLIGNTLSEALGIGDMTNDFVEQFRTSFAESFKGNNLVDNAIQGSIEGGVSGAVEKGTIQKKVSQFFGGGLTRAMGTAAALAAAVGLFRVGIDGGIESFGLGNRLKRIFFRSSFDGFKDAFGNLNQSTLPNIFRAFRQQFRFGIGAEDTAKVLRAQIETGQVGVEAAFRIQDAVTRFAGQRGVLPADVMKDLASNTELFAKFAKDGGLNLGMAAVQARELGLSLDVVGQVAESVLDFQSSIEGELKASLLIGRQLNLNRARELSLAGDIAGLQQEIVKIVGTEAEFNRLNVIERKALAQALGLSVTQLQKYVSGAETLKDTVLQQNTQQMKRLTVTMGIFAGIMGASLGLQVGGAALSFYRNMLPTGVARSANFANTGRYIVPAVPGFSTTDKNIAKSKVAEVTGKTGRLRGMAGSLKGTGQVLILSALLANSDRIFTSLKQLVGLEEKVEQNTRKTVSTMARDSNWPLITSDKLVSNRVNYTPQKG